MSLSRDRNIRVFTVGTNVLFRDRVYVVCAGPVADYHGDNYYFLQNLDYAPLSACAREIFTETD